MYFAVHRDSTLALNLLGQADCAWEALADDVAAIIPPYVEFVEARGVFV
jgi:hypothetical protein